VVVTELDQNLPEVPHEGAPYQGYGPAPYEPPAPVPPPVPPGYGMPYQQPAPSDQPPPSYSPPPIVQGSMTREQSRSGDRSIAPSADGEIVQKWGYVFAISTLIMPVLGLVGLVLGIITATKPHRERHGIAIIGISLVLGVLAVVLWSVVNDDS
jgi:hypothetical protein